MGFLLKLSFLFFPFPLSIPLAPSSSLSGVLRRPSSEDPLLLSELSGQLPGGLVGVSSAMDDYGAIFTAVERSCHFEGAQQPEIAKSGLMLLRAKTRVGAVVLGQGSVPSPDASQVPARPIHRFMQPVLAWNRYQKWPHLRPQYVSSLSDEVTA